VRRPHNAAERRFIKTGMYASEIRRKFGSPDEIVRPESKNDRKPNSGDARQWVYLPADGDPQTTTVLTVRRGMVLHVDRKVTY
jgi:hypothetical protein